MQSAESFRLSFPGLSLIVDTDARPEHAEPELLGDSSWTFRIEDLQRIGADELAFRTRNGFGEERSEPLLAALDEERDWEDFEDEDKAEEVQTRNVDASIVTVRALMEHAKEEHARTGTVREVRLGWEGDSSAYWLFHDLTHAIEDVEWSEDGGGVFIGGAWEEDRANLEGARRAVRYGMDLEEVLGQLVALQGPFRERFKGEESTALQDFLAGHEDEKNAQAYREHVQDIAADAFDPSESLEDLEERAWEHVDGDSWLESYAGRILAHSDSDGSDYVTGEEDSPRVALVARAFGALLGDVRARLQELHEESRCESCGRDPKRAGFATCEDCAEEEERPAPEDYVVSSNGFRLSVGIVEGAHVGEFAEHEDAEDAIREHRTRTSPDFFPEVWFVDDHGGARRYSSEGFAWNPPAPELDRETVEASAARTAFVLAWADAEERDGRTYPGEDLDEVAPDYVPGRFRAWARDVLSAALGATAPGDGIADAWARADAETLGRALALSCGGWTDGLGEAELPRPANLPHLDADARLFVEPSEFRADVPSVEDIKRAAGRAADPDSAAERVRTAIEDAESAEDVLALANELLRGFGVESLELPAPDEGADAGTVRYVNLGDTYRATLCHVEDSYTPGGRFLVADWGSLLEQAEEERTYSTGEVRCPNCGDWTGAGSLDSEDGCNACGWTN